MGTVTETTYLSCADTARYVRKALKREFPGVKFSVRSKTYSGGASITVKWVDGPTYERVDGVVGRYEGATFDPMHDLKEYVLDELSWQDDPARDGERVHWGADWIHTERSYSREFAEAVRAEAVRLYREELRGEWPQVRQAHRGWCLDWEDDPWLPKFNCTAAQVFHKLARKMEGDGMEARR